MLEIAKGKAEKLIQAVKDKADAILDNNLLLSLSAVIIVLIIHGSAFISPVFLWLPRAENADSFLKAIWQIHASILGITVIVVTLIITIIAYEKDRARTWQLYLRKTWFVPILWFNLLALMSEGMASIQTYAVEQPIFVSDKMGNLILSEGILLALSILMAGWLFTITTKFLSDDYVDEYGKRRIVQHMPMAVNRDIQSRQELAAKLQAETDGH